MRSRSQPPPSSTRRRRWCLPSRPTIAPVPSIFASQRDLVLLSLLLTPERD
jgi:hypothetical protein